MLSPLSIMKGEESAQYEGGWQDDTSNVMREKCEFFLIFLPASLSPLQANCFDISFSPGSLSSSIHAYGRLCDRNFNLKHMREILARAAL